jgi:hypothetical protein
MSLPPKQWELRKEKEYNVLEREICCPQGEQYSHRQMIHYTYLRNVSVDHVAQPELCIEPITSSKGCTRTPLAYSLKIEMPRSGALQDHASSISILDYGRIGGLNDEDILAKWKLQPGSDQEVITRYMLQRESSGEIKAYAHTPEPRLYMTDDEIERFKNAAYPALRKVYDECNSIPANKRLRLQLTIAENLEEMCSSYKLAAVPVRKKF